MELPAACPPQPSPQSHSSEQYSRKQLIASPSATSFAGTQSLHAAIERPNQQQLQQTRAMQSERVLPPFSKQQTDKG